MKINRWRRASHARTTRRGGCRCSGGRKEGWREKNLLQPGCKPGRLQPLTKMRIDPTCRLIIQQKRYLVDLQVGSILIFVRGCKRPGLQPGCNKFFSARERRGRAGWPWPWLRPRGVPTRSCRGSPCGFRDAHGPIQQRPAGQAMVQRMRDSLPAFQKRTRRDETTARSLFFSIGERRRSGSVTAPPDP
jgi:hypothetical protein